MLHRKINGAIILSGGLVKDKNGWRTTKFSDKSGPDKALGDNLRVFAGFHLYKEQSKRNPDFFILVSGGRGYLWKIKGVPAVADVIEQELIRLGVPSDKIYKEKKSNNTYQQLKVITRLALKNKWKKIAVVSNAYHLPRIKAFIDCLPGLRPLKSRLLLLSAEKILLAEDKKNWDGIIKRAYKSGWMKNRLILEKRGIKQLKSGFYRLR